LKDLEARLNPAQFVRLGRGALANLEMLRRVSPMPGGTYVATLSNGQQLNISRLQGRILREHLLKLRSLTARPFHSPVTFNRSPALSGSSFNFRCG
jgi:hypothetical protein